MRAVEGERVRTKQIKEVNGGRCFLVTSDSSAGSDAVLMFRNTVQLFIRLNVHSQLEH